MPQSVSVVLVCRNAAPTIGEQLEALAEQSYDGPWQLVVADNGSSDGTLSVVERYRDRLPLTLVDARAVHGIGGVRNRAVAGSEGDAVAFCDADDQVAPGWLAAMAAALAANEFVAARPEYERLNPTWIAESWDPPPEDGLRAHRFPPFLKYAGGGCLGIRRSVHDEVGGFDEGLISCEDDDYCFRVQLAGHELVPAPGAVVHIRLRTTPRELFTQARWYAEGEAQLQRKFRDAGPGPSLWKWPLLHWGAITRAARRAGSRSGRARLSWLLGFQFGRYRGSLKHRILAR